MLLQIMIGPSPPLLRMTAPSTPQAPPTVTLDITPITNVPNQNAPPSLTSSYILPQTQPLNSQSRNGLPASSSQLSKLPLTICLISLPPNSKPRDSHNEPFNLHYINLLTTIIGAMLPPKTQFTSGCYQKTLTLYLLQNTICNGVVQFKPCWIWMRMCYASRSQT